MDLELDNGGGNGDDFFIGRTKRKRTPSAKFAVSDLVVAVVYVYDYVRVWVYVYVSIIFVLKSCTNPSL